MPKICSEEGCEYPIWSRKTGKCKLHQPKIPKDSNPIHRFKRINKVSDKQKKRNAEYLKVRLEYLNENKLCEVCGKPATDVHHKQSRLGDNLTDKSKFMAVCRPCHAYIEEHREWSYEKRYLIKRL